MLIFATARADDDRSLVGAPTFDELKVMVSMVPFPFLVGPSQSARRDPPFQIDLGEKASLLRNSGRLYSDGALTYLFVYPGPNGKIDSTTETLKLMLAPSMLGTTKLPDGLVDDSFSRFDLANEVAFWTDFGLTSYRENSERRSYQYRRGDQLKALLSRLATNRLVTRLPGTPPEVDFVRDSAAIENALNLAWGSSESRIHLNVSYLTAEKYYILTISDKRLPAFISLEQARAELTSMGLAHEICAAGMFPAQIEPSSEIELPSVLDGQDQVLEFLVPSLSMKWERFRPDLRDVSDEQ